MAGVANAAAGAVTRASDALAEQQVAVAALTDTSGASAAKLQEATAAKAAADADAPVRADLRAKAAAAPLSTLIADAKVTSDPTTRIAILSARKNLNDNFLEHGYMDLADARSEVEQAASRAPSPRTGRCAKAYTGQFPAGASAEAVVAWRSELARTRADCRTS